MTQREKAAALRRMHVEPELLVLVNVWDAVSARTAAAVPGCRALATASWSIAATHGVPDGEQLARDQMIEAIARVTHAVDQPVSADLEGGYGATAADVGDTVTAALTAGAVGCNLEDGTGDERAPLRPTAEHAERIAAARAAGARDAIPVVINARTDVFLAGVGEEDERVDLALERGRAYVDAGADCVFVPAAWRPEDLARLVAGMGAPVSVLAVAGIPAPAELQQLGIARLSLGPGSLGVAMEALHNAATELLGEGTLPAGLHFRPPTPG